MKLLPSQMIAVDYQNNEKIYNDFYKNDYEKQFRTNKEVNEDKRKSIEDEKESWSMGKKRLKNRCGYFENTNSFGKIIKDNLIKNSKSNFTKNLNEVYKFNLQI